MRRISVIDRGSACYGPFPLQTGSSAIRTYIQYYTYDEAGNALRTWHTTVGGTGNWTFDYTPDTGSNRILSWSIGGGSSPEDYSYDARGNMKSGMAHLYTGGDSLYYNEENRLEKVALMSGGQFTIFTTSMIIAGSG